MLFEVQMSSVRTTVYDDADDNDDDSPKGDVKAIYKPQWCIYKLLVDIPAPVL